MAAVHNDQWPTNGTGNWQKSTVSDLNVWQQYYRVLAATTNEFPVAPQPQSPAADLLLALSKYDSAIEELRQASKQPYSRFPLNYDSDSPGTILLPHLASLKRAAQMLQLRATAELQLGQSEKALDNVKLMLRLADSIRTEPILISHLVRIAMVNITLQPIWEGLAEHKWSDAQLVKLDSELAKLDFLPDYGTAMRGEMVLCQEGIIDYLRRHPGQISNMSYDGDSKRPAPTISISYLIPSGWFFQNQLRCSRFMVQQYLPLADLERRIIAPASLRHANAALDSEFRHASAYNRLEVMFLPAFGGAVKKFAYAQTSVDLARVAIALERYRLAHGGYPESLDALAPQFIAKIPHDIINGQPLHYRRTSDPSSQSSDAASGQFVLYSVGWNEADDGGEVGRIKYGTPDISEGDWVWRYPSK
jgi:tetratricopeptide (TPR) repeat protein